MSDAALLVRSLESAHFGLPVFSATAANRADATRLLDLAAGIEEGLLVIRIPADAHGAIHAVERRGAVLCDVLQTLTIAVPGHHRTLGEQHGTTIRAGTSNDADVMATIGGDAFRGFVGHWHSDDRLRAGLADQLYARWSADLARGADAAHPVLLAERASKPIAFLALARVTDTTWSVALTCVAPEYRTSGAFRTLLDAACDMVADQRAVRLEYETQLTNLPALRAVIRAGFEPKSARLTFHLWMSGA